MAKPKRSALLPSGNPIDRDEVKDAVLRLLVERFYGRVTTEADVLEVTQGLALAAFHLKQVAVFTPRA